MTLATRRWARSVDWCAWNTHRVNVWNRDGSGEIEGHPFRCKSWRCPRCRPWVGLCDYARVAHALCSRDRWLYLVLTLPPEDHASRDRWALYRGAGERWRDRLLPTLSRAFDRIEYVQTWEQHASGVPHLNVVLRSDRLLETSDKLGSHVVSYGANRGRRVVNIRKMFRRLARRSGFGDSLWIEETWTPTAGGERPNAGLASYLVKLARTLGCEDQERRKGEKLAGELTRSEAKSNDQTPIAAPVGFRRLRASRGLLPPRYRGDPERSGRLGPSSDPPWTWRVVQEIEAGKSRKILGAVALVQELEAKGLTPPECVARLLQRWEKQTRRNGSSLAPSVGNPSLPADSGSIASTGIK